MGKVLETALYWRRLGVSTIPIGYMSKQPKVKWLPYTEQLPTINDLENWFASDMTNIGIITGWQNLCILDFDEMDVFLKWMRWATDTGGKARMVATQARMHLSARGVHVFILSENASNLKLPKIDVLAQRKYALLPPSLHPTGVPYQIYRDALPMPVASLYDVFPRELLHDAIAPRTVITPSAQQYVRQNTVFDPWAVAGKDIENQNLVDTIKAQIPISSILSGLEDTGGNGRWKMTKCPFHDDKNPSFWVDTVNQICGCHAGCTPLPLDVIDLYARLNGIDNQTAIRELAKRL